MGAQSPNQPSQQAERSWSRALKGATSQFLALLISGFGPSFAAAALAAIAYLWGHLVSSAYLTGAAIALAGFAVVWALARLVRRHLWPKLRAIKAGLQAWVEAGTAEQQQRDLERQAQAIRSLTNHEEQLKRQLEPVDRLREQLEVQKRRVAVLKKDRKRDRKDYERALAKRDRLIAELTPLAELGKLHILASSVIAGWLTYLSSWPEGVTPLKRTTDFIADYFRPGLARVFPELRRSGVALIADEAGTYRLVCEELAPEAVRAVGPQPVRHGLETCLDKLGVTDFVIIKLPDAKCKDHAEWLVLFARVEPDPTFDLMMSAGTKVLSLSRGV